MWKKILIALICLEIILVNVLRHNPASATVNNPDVYTWSFRGSSEQLVCKQVMVRPGHRYVPKSSQQDSIKLRSQTVDDSYCSNLTKPVNSR